MQNGSDVIPVHEASFHDMDHDIFRSGATMVIAGTLIRRREEPEWLHVESSVSTPTSTAPGSRRGPLRVQGDDANERPSALGREALALGLLAPVLLLERLGLSVHQPGVSPRKLSSSSRLLDVGFFLCSHLHPPPFGVCRSVPPPSADAPKHIGGGEGGGCSPSGKRSCSRCRSIRTRRPRVRPSPPRPPG